jgi:hypothetical protein
MHTLFASIGDFMMKTITIRGITTDMSQAIKEKAKERNLSINEWFLRTISVWAGLDKKPLFTEYHDLDALAGGWSRNEVEKFTRCLKGFEKIDRDIWK